MKKNSVHNIILAAVLIELVVLAGLLAYPHERSSAEQEEQTTQEPAAVVEEQPATSIDGIEYKIENVQQLVERAEALFRDGEYGRTIEIFKRVLELDPTNHAVWAKLAHTYRYWYHMEESEQAFLKAIELDPQNDFYYTDLAKLYRNTHNFEKANWALQESLKINPNNAMAYSYGLGYLYFEFQQYEDSEKAFLKALSMDPEQEMAYMGLGDLYREMGRYEESEEMYKEAFKREPHSEAYLGLGWLYLYQHRYEEAEVPLRAFLENIREKGEVYYALGKAYQGGGKFEKARDAYQRAVELTEDNPMFSSVLEELLKNHPELSNS